MAPTTNMMTQDTTSDMVVVHAVIDCIHVDHCSMSCSSTLAMGLLHLATRRSIIYAGCMLLFGMENELKCIALNMQRNVNTAEILSRIHVLPYVICSDNNLNSK